MSRLLKTYLILFASLVFLAILDWKWTDPIGTIGWIVFYILTANYLVRIFRRVFRKFLWRIRRKLILSYIFIGFIPIFLLAILFLLGTFIFMGQATSEMFNSSLDNYELQTKNEAEKLLHLTEFMDDSEAMNRWFNELRAEDREWFKNAAISLTTSEGSRSLKGDGVIETPSWLKDGEFSGLVLRDGSPWLAGIRYDQERNRALIVLVPVNSRLMDLIKKKIEADLEYLPLSGQGAKNEFEETVDSSSNEPYWPKWWDLPIWWLSIPDQYDWKTGERISLLEDEKKEILKDKQKTVLKSENGGMTVTVDDVNAQKKEGMGAFVVRTHISRVYSHIFSRSTALQKFVYVIMISVALTFLVIELISLISAFFLAKSITASVHNLFEGTERIKSGDLNYQIKVAAHDQLGDLAASFNSMTQSVKNLLKERAEKERLAESLRIARQMQQNLLPREVPAMGDIEIATMNIPAQELCGDYYDIIRKGDQEMGIIIADVSGKGPSAALYMAEVKGVILSITQRTMQPRTVLIEANHILAPTLDTRNFITMTYAVVCENQRLLRMSRAGHNPLLHYSALTDQVDVVQPSGIGLGLGRNGMFERTLEEVDRTLNIGDILVFYTDGLTEAMDDQNRLYGLSRLSDIILANKAHSSEKIKTAIFVDLQNFLKNNSPQDDITLVLLKVG